MTSKREALWKLALFIVLVALVLMLRNVPAQAAQSPVVPEVALQVMPQVTSSPGPLLPDDPLQRCAAKALRGDYGTLCSWQRDAYQWVRARGVTCCGAAKVTSYGYKWESAAMAGGTRTASGSHVHTRGCAANPELPFGTLIWTPYGLRYVNDRGGWVKVGYAWVYGRRKRVTSRREVANVDYYTLTGWDTLRNAPFAVVKRTGDRTVWHQKG